MKLLRTIFAFLTIYLFVFAISIFIVVSFWLRTFIPDSNSQIVAKVTVGKLEETSAPFAYLHNSGTNALVTTITRSEDISEFKGQKVLSARSTVVFITFDKLKLDESLVPLGYKNLYRISRATDAKGKVIYERKTSIVDDFIKDFGSQYISWDNETLTVLANDRPTTYLITAVEEELFLGIEYEN